MKLQRSPTTCVKPNTIAGGYKHTCFKPPENDGGLAQFAGNEMQSQEVTNRCVYNKMQLEEVINTLVLNNRRMTEILIQSKKNHRLMFCDLKLLLKVGRLCTAGAGANKHVRFAEQSNNFVFNGVEVWFN